MEKETKLKTKDGHIIYGILNTSEEPNNKLTIFVHGLTGHPNEHTFYNAAHQFPKEGVDTFRFALYTGEDGGRKLSECTISTHAKDLNEVLDHFRDKYKKIVVVGHSLGCPTILKSDLSKVDNIIFWDASYWIEGRDEISRKTEVNGEDFLIEEWGVEYLLKPEMLDEWTWFNAKNELEIIKNFNNPIKIIVAGNGLLIEGNKKYYESANEPKAFASIEGADHGFDEKETEKELLNETLAWIKKFE